VNFAVNIEPVFISGGKLRAIWRFLIAVVAVLICSVGVPVMLGMVFALAQITPTFVLANSLSALLTLPALLGAVKLLTHYLEDQPAGSAGLALCGRWQRELLTGLAVGTVMVVAVGIAEWALDAARFRWSGAPGADIFLSGCTAFIVMAFAAANEEIIFRGYPFQRLVESVGAPAAILVLSGLFGAVHLGNPHASWVGAANTALVGLPFSVAYLRTRMLWLPIGMHFAWNFVLGYVLGLPVSGLILPVSILKAEPTGPAILTGGPYGPEAGLLATGVILIATGYLGFSRSIYVSEETRVLVFPNPVGASRSAVDFHAAQAGPAREKIES
jgi:hypothetical protein